MAEVEFGDSELFQQLDDESLPLHPAHLRFTEEEEGHEETRTLQNRLEESDAYIQTLQEENKSLKRKLNILTRPSGITVKDVSTDGPLLQILFSNNIVSKKCRQEIEDSICGVILKQQKWAHQKKHDHVKPQASAFILEDESTSSTVRTTAEAFKVVGSVSYFSDFCVDQLGQPLVNDNPQMTDGWETPLYLRIFNQLVGTDEQEMEMRDSRPKSLCFNCGCSSHQLRDCPKPKDMAAINERRKEFTQNSGQTIQGNRYHADEVEERFAKYKPGIMSEELLAALGVDGNRLPPLIYRMRQLGYPPGWLKEAEMETSGLMLYDGNGSDDGISPMGADGQKPSYDVSKLVDFPGFNMPAQHNTKDEFMHYGSIPMQHSHMKHNFAAYLSNNFPMPGASSNKRRHESDSSPQTRKKTRSSPDGTPGKSSDMDLDSDSGTPQRGAANFQFHPPLPPGSPCFSSPPPLPQGTPPATPTPPPLPKGTPPSTPSNGSPALQGSNWVGVEEAMEGTEDELTLEELEEQQRQIWAALENADTATNSDSDTPVMGTPLPSSPSISTPAHADTETETEDQDADDAVDAKGLVEITPGMSNEQNTPMIQEMCPQSPDLVKAQEENPQSSEPIISQEESPESPGPVKSQDESPQSPELVKPQIESPESPRSGKSQEGSSQSLEPVKSQDESPQSPDPDQDGKSPTYIEKITAVPHLSKFAAGIVPFEDTPEYTEVAEATGTYLRIRDLLKKSPRNSNKMKNQNS